MRESGIALNSTEKAIQAAGKALLLDKVPIHEQLGPNAARYEQETQEFADLAIRAALASGELHPADECPNKAEGAANLLDHANQRAEKAEIEKERILDGLAAELGDENMALNESLVQRAEKAEAELADLKSKIENGELIEKKRLFPVGLNSVIRQGEKLYRLLDKEPARSESTE